MWNASLDEKEIRRQLTDFKSKGVDGFFIHPMPSEFRPADFPGGMPGYLSEHYFKMVRAAVECAAELDMDAWLYDEAGWPSGTLNGYFRAERPDLYTRYILPDGSFSFNDFCPDLLNPEVTQIFLERVHERYREYLGGYFGNTIPGIFTDEPHFGFFNSEKLPFSPVFVKRFEEKKKYAAADAAMRIFQQKDGDAILDFCEVWMELIRENFLFPIRKWCHRNGLLLTGHFNGDDTVNNLLCQLAGDPWAAHECLDVCGCDAIWRQIHPLMPETDFSRLTASAAGGKRTLSETFAVYGFDLSLAEMKQIAAMQFVAGIEIVAPMALHYSNEGGRQITTVSNFYGADPRWENYRCFADFTRRMSAVFDRTVPVIKASVPFPVKELRTGKIDPESIFAGGLSLARKQITYDYSPESDGVPQNIPQDVELLSPEPMLRTRHLRSPRGERRIFVNAGTADISVKFPAPAGYNAWYDPSSGRHHAAVADADGILALDLPFAGVMVLLTIPGTPVKALPKTDTLYQLPLDFRFTEVVRTVKASPAGLVEVPNAAAPSENFCGTLRYEAKAELSQAGTVTITLPSAKRAMCSLVVNGQKFPKVWPPYAWEVKLPAGENRIVVEVANTPGKAMDAPEHLAYLEENKFSNTYFERCREFEELFPDEEPLAPACLTIKKGCVLNID